MYCKENVIEGIYIYHGEKNVSESVKNDKKWKTNVFLHDLVGCSWDFLLGVTNIY